VNIALASKDRRSGLSSELCSLDLRHLRRVDRVPTVGAKKKKWFAIARIVLFENLLTND
jgi:hypothetical protein